MYFPALWLLHKHHIYCLTIWKSMYSDCLQSLLAIQRTGTCKIAAQSHWVDCEYANLHTQAVSVGLDLNVWSTINIWRSLWSQWKLLPSSAPLKPCHLAWPVLMLEVWVTEVFASNKHVASASLFFDKNRKKLWTNIKIMGWRGEVQIQLWNNGKVICF